jgi:hypothetical protein
VLGHSAGKGRVRRYASHVSDFEARFDPEYISPGGRHKLGVGPVRNIHTGCGSEENPHSVLYQRI